MASIDWAAGHDRNYALELRDELSPALLARLDTAVTDLQAALLRVQAAVAVLDGVGGILERVAAEYREAGGDASEAVYDALRERTSYGRALDLAYHIDNELERVL
jgi:hypothetical protein